MFRTGIPGYVQAAFKPTADVQQYCCRIWSVAQNVWKDITSAMVCRAFVLAYRIMREIVEEDGNNAWTTLLIPMMAFNQPCEVHVPTVAVKLDDTMGFAMDCQVICYT
jgi:hypothetical protein